MIPVLLLARKAPAIVYPHNIFQAQDIFDPLSAYITPAAQYQIRYNLHDQEWEARQNLYQTAVQSELQDYLPIAYLPFLLQRSMSHTIHKLHNKEYGVCYRRRLADVVK